MPAAEIIGQHTGRKKEVVTTIGGDVGHMTVSLYRALDEGRWLLNRPR
jgi:hypothetical protein